jgi:cell fate (sporulation/competence/biofilm development) regulator YmcA (YheA/YmcA/DUF963 family)
MSEPKKQPEFLTFAREDVQSDLFLMESWNARKYPIYSCDVVRCLDEISRLSPNRDIPEKLSDKQITIFANHSGFAVFDESADCGVGSLNTACRDWVRQQYSDMLKFAIEKGLIKKRKKIVELVVKVPIFQHRPDKEKKYVKADHYDQASGKIIQIRRSVDALEERPLMPEVAEMVGESGELTDELAKYIHGKVLEQQLASNN